MSGWCRIIMRVMVEGWKFTMMDHGCHFATTTSTEIQLTEHVNSWDTLAIAVLGQLLILGKFSC